VALFALVLRLAGLSGPYFADAFRHIRAIDSGRMVIHAPGYLVFNLLGWTLSHLLHISTAHALQGMNVVFSVAGAAVFYLVAVRLNSASPFLLALAYACSPVVWFSGDVHSSYAASTFFAPLLLLMVEGERRFVWGSLVWALLAAFRASDGAFVLPWMIFQSRNFTWKQRLAGIAVAAPVTAAWWALTNERYRSGGALSPMLYSGMQVHGLAQGVLAGNFNIHALVNAFHAVAGMTITWGLLLPAVCLGLAAARGDRAESDRAGSDRARSMALYLAPGLAFFLLYYVADAPYFAYTAAAGMLLAGEFLARGPVRRGQAVLGAAICGSLLFMFAARTVSSSGSRAKAVADAYFLKYSVPSMKARKDPRLAALLGACGDADVLGICR
jgi:hypothetical protein